MLYFVSRTLHTDDALMWDSLSNFQSQELGEQSTRHFHSNTELAHLRCLVISRCLHLKLLFQYQLSVCASDGYSRYRCSWKCKPPWNLRPVDTAKYPQHFVSINFVPTSKFPTVLLFYPQSCTTLYGPVCYKCYMCLFSS